MEKELLAGNLGEKANYKVDFKEGKLQAEMLADFGPFHAGMKMQLEADGVLDALAKAIPGTIDDAMLGLIKAALKA